MKSNVSDGFVLWRVSDLMSSKRNATNVLGPQEACL